MREEKESATRVLPIPACPTSALCLAPFESSFAHSAWRNERQDSRPLSEPSRFGADNLAMRARSWRIEKVESESEDLSRILVEKGKCFVSAAEHGQSLSARAHHILVQWIEVSQYLSDL